MYDHLSYWLEKCDAWIFGDKQLRKNGCAAIMSMVGKVFPCGVFYEI